MSQGEQPGSCGCATILAPLMLFALPIAAYQLGYGWWGVVIGILVAIPLAGLLLTLFCAILLNLDRSKRKP